jgi:mono/diheme cytochrome c family protein
MYKQKVLFGGHMMLRHFRYILLLIIGGTVLILPGAAAQTDDEDLIARGRYITQISSCETCHTPYVAELADFTVEQLVDLSLRERNVIDLERPFAGGRVFDLGPAGVIVSRNLTSDEETGIGAWTDEEIETAVRTGVSRDGRQLHPIMPYSTFNRMGSDDMEALIAYLRSLEPIENEVPVIDFGIPPMGFTMPEEAIETPDPSDTEARGIYLMTGVMPCTDCHTPLDPETGIPMIEDAFLAGGQPYEGPWGIVYGGNITPHADTGLGDWTDEEIIRAMASGVGQDGRRLILMPWQDYSNLTLEDVTAVLSFLRNDLPAVDNEVPEAAVEEPFIETIDD